MVAVQVKYTVQPGFVEENKANIHRVMDAIKSKPIDGMLYSTYTIDDGNTFVHINMAKDQQTLSSLNNVPEFTEFRMALKASNPVSPPNQTDLNPVGAGFEL